MSSSVDSQKLERHPSDQMGEIAVGRGLVTWMWAGAIAILAWVPVLRVVAEYFDSWMAIGVAAVAAGGVVQWLIVVYLISPRSTTRLGYRVEQATKSWLFVMALVAIWVTVMLIVYPIADSRREIGAGSDADDAFIGAAQKLISGSYPYDENTYLNGPISTGPGWLVLVMPFGLWRGIYPLLIPTVLLVVVTLLRKNPALLGTAGAFLLILTLSPSFIEAAVTGHDLPAVGSIIAILLFFWRKNIQRPIKAVGVGILAGLVLTSRVPFAAFLVLLFLGSDGARSIRTRWTAALTATIVVFAFHVAFALWGQGQYPPSHTWDGIVARVSWQGLIAIAVGAVVAVAILPSRTGLAPQRLVSLAAILMLVVAAVYDGSAFFKDDFDLAFWEISTTTAFALPIVTLAALLSSRPAPARSSRKHAD